MCTVAPFTAGRLFGLDAAPPPPVALQERTTSRSAACFVPPPLVPPCSYEYTTAGFETERSEDVIRCVKRIRILAVAAIRGFFGAALDPAPAASQQQEYGDNALDPAPAASQQQEYGDNDGPTTPVATLRAPLSHGDIIDTPAAIEISFAKTNTDHDHDAKKRKRRTSVEEDPSWPYDADLDAAYRETERDPTERASEDYIWTTQEWHVTESDRAELVAWMYGFSRTEYDLPPDTLHRAVGLVDRFLSSTKVVFADRLRLLGAAAVSVAAKYEDKWVLDVAPEVRDAERELVRAVGYRLSGPTAATFVDHFTRPHRGDDKVRCLAQHLADLTLLDYRCVPFLPSAVAAAAILLARRVVVTNNDNDSGMPWSDEMVRITGYTAKDIAGVVDAIYNMHARRHKWPGVALMIDDYGGYALPSR